MKRIGVLCTDPFLFQKINLALPRPWECIHISDGDEAYGFDVCFVDTDFFKAPSGINAVRMSRASDCELRIPFAITELMSFVTEQKDTARKLILDEERRTVRFGKELIHLTELEFTLLSLLASERGRFFSKEEILSHIWDSDADKGIINVYIHYLRTKIEKNGEKVIISSRNNGYKIDERFLEGESTDAPIY